MIKGILLNLLNRPTDHVVCFIRENHTPYVLGEETWCDWSGEHITANNSKEEER